MGGLGRHTLLDCLPVLRERYAPTFVVVNGENAAGGLGITPKIADQMFAAGVDAITLGNHTYHRREIYPYLANSERIVRPANFLRSQPGRGVCVVEHDGVRLGVVNLSGNLYLRAGRSAFTEIEVALGELGEVEHILVDMHAEATSEKVAMGWHLDGRVTAVVGTHTHVPTADARVLPGGTAYITDVGMTGPRGGVIGVKREQAIESLLTQMPIRFETSEEDPWLMGVLISCSAAAAGRLDRAGADAAAGQRGRSGSLRAPEQRDDHEREEPRDVQVEPVFDAQLLGDDHRRARRRQADDVGAAGQDGERERERDRARSRRRARAPAARTGPRPRTASRGWTGRRSCARRSCAASRGRARGSTRAQRCPRTRPRTAPARARAVRAGARHRPCVASSGASASGANLVRPASAASAPRPARASSER